MIFLLIILLEPLKGIKYNTPKLYFLTAKLENFQYLKSYIYILLGTTKDIPHTLTTTITNITKIAKGCILIEDILEKIIDDLSYYFFF